MPKTSKHHPNWGGARKGAGPKRFLINPIDKTLTLEKIQLEQLKEWADDRKMNLSEAVRTILAEVLAHD